MEKFFELPQRIFVIKYFIHKKFEHLNFPSKIAIHWDLSDMHSDLHFASGANELHERFISMQSERGP